MSLLEQVNKFFHKRVSRSSADDDESVETDESRKINNVIAAPAPTIVSKLDDDDKESKQ